MFQDITLIFSEGIVRELLSLRKPHWSSQNSAFEPICTLRISDLWIL